MPNEDFKLELHTKLIEVGTDRYGQITGMFQGGPETGTTTIAMTEKMAQRIARHLYCKVRITIEIDED